MSRTLRVFASLVLGGCVSEVTSNDTDATDEIGSSGTGSAGQESTATDPTIGDSSGENTSAESSNSEDTDEDTGTDGGEIVEPVGTSVLIHVTAAEGASIGPVRVTLDGVEHFTNPAGFILFEDLAPGNFSATISVSGYVSAIASATLVEDENTEIPIQLLPIELTMAFDAGQGADIVHEGLSIEIPPNAFVNQYGEPVQGLVEAQLTVIDPTGEDIFSLPAPLHGVTFGDEEDVYLQSLGMFDISVWQDGQALQLAPNNYATVELELPELLASNYAPDDTIPAWWLDPNSGLWLEEATGTVVDLDPQDPNNPLIWRVNIPHFSAWNCDSPVPASQLECFVIAAKKNDVLVNQAFTLHGTEPGLVGFKDFASSKKTLSNVGGNCVVALMGSNPVLTYTSYEQNYMVGPLQGSGMQGTCKDPPFWGTPNPGCTLIEVEVLAPFECSSGASRLCEYDPQYINNLNQGICRQGSEYCFGGAWSGCEGANTYPAQYETCATPNVDDNCNGTPYDLDAIDCQCVPMQTTACYTGPLGTEGVGVCKSGQKPCSQGGIWAQCVNGGPNGQVLPSAENCNTAADENCDGAEEVNCMGQDCCRGAPVWSKNFASNGVLNVGYGIATSKNSNELEPGLFVVGGFDNATDFNDSNMFEFGETAAGGTDAFIVKLKQNEQGAYNWSRSWGGDYNDRATAVASDVHGAAYVVGEQSPSANNLDIFVTKYNSAGTQQWSKSYGGVNPDAASGVATWNPPLGSMQEHRVYVTGTSFGNDVPCQDCGIAGQDAFVLALNAQTGDTVWGYAYGAGTDEGKAIAVDSAGNVVVAGSLSNGADFAPNDPDAGEHTAIGAKDMFVLKLGYDESYHWSRTFAAQGGTAWAMGVTVDDVNNVYITGFYNKPFDMDGHLLPPSNTDDIFVAKLDADTGVCLWAKGYPGVAVDRSLGISWLSVQDVGRVYFTGWFGGTVNFGMPMSLQAVGFRDMMLVALDDVSGDTVWDKRVGVGPTAAGWAVATSSYGVFVTGGFDGNATFDNVIPLANPGGTDVFVAKYTQ